MVSAEIVGALGLELELVESANLLWLREKFLGTLMTYHGICFKGASAEVRLRSRGSGPGIWGLGR
jgi:hypothetical protein